MKKIVTMSALLLSIISSTASASVTSATTNISNVPIHASSNSSQIIWLVPTQNTLLPINSSTTNYYQINYDNTNGYIQKAYTLEGTQELQSQTTLTPSSSDTFSDNSPSDFESFKAMYLTESNKKSYKTYIELCKAFYRNYNFYYSTSTTMPPTLSNPRTDCSTYVSLVLYEYGKANNISSLMATFSSRKRSGVFNDIGRNLAKGKTDPNFTLVKNIQSASYGDILCYNGHVEIYAGQTVKGHAKVYNCGYTGAIRSSNLVTTASRNISELKYNLRVKTLSN